MVIPFGLCRFGSPKANAGGMIYPNGVRFGIDRASRARSGRNEPGKADTEMSNEAGTPSWKPLTDDFAVAGQLYPDDMATIAEAGFAALICNRPDGEAPDEPQFDAVSEAAEKVGLEVRYIPVSHQIGLTSENVAQMQAALSELPTPVLAYCRSGARSAKLFEIAQG